MNVVSSRPVRDLSRQQQVCKDDLPRVYDQARRPTDGSMTRTEWLVHRRRRVPKKARPVAVLDVIKQPEFQHGHRNLGAACLTRSRP